MATPDVGDGVHVLLAMDGRLARAERIASHRDRLPGEAHDCFRIDAVCLTRLAVPLITELSYVHQRWTESGGELSVKAIAVHKRGTGVLEGTRRAAVLEALAGEALRVVAGRELIAVTDVPVALAEVNILVEGAVVVIDARRQVVHRSRLERIRRSRQRYQNGITGQVALSIVIEEEEQLVFLYRSTNVAAELVEVISRLQRKWPASALSKCPLQAVDGIVGVQSAIAEELEGRAVIRVGSRFGNDIDHSSAGSS